MTAITFLGESRKLETKPACPECGSALDGVTGVNCEDLPKDGDVTVCVYCANVMLFTGKFPNLGLRSATSTEVAEIVAEQPLLLSVISAIRNNQHKRVA